MTLGGRRVAVRRPRVRSADDRHELAVQTYEYFADRDPLTQAVMDRMLAGVSTRKFARVGEPVGLGVETEASATGKSSVSEIFVERTRTALEEPMSRRLDEVRGRLRQAWALSDPDLAEQRLRLLASELDPTWPDAAASLRERMAETLTLTRLGITGQLAKTLCSTNPCESMIEIVSHTSATSNAGEAATCASAGPPPACSSPSNSSDGSSATATSPSS
jgi:hypothetical protein